MSVTNHLLNDLTGPRGGNVNDPRLHPEARRAPLNVKIDPATGLPGLHSSKPKEFRDTAIHGRIAEPPWARMAVYMLLAGRTNSEIAAAANVDPTTVADVRSNRWFQELLALLANEKGDEIQGVLDGYALEAVEGIAALARGAEGERTRLVAYTTLLEHARGKARQAIDVTSTRRTYASPEEEYAEIQREIENVRRARAQTVEALPPATTT